MHAHDDGGLAQDLKLLRANLERRTLLRFALGASLLPLVGCGGDDPEVTPLGDAVASTL